MSQQSPKRQALFSPLPSLLFLSVRNDRESIGQNSCNRTDHIIVINVRAYSLGRGEARTLQSTANANFKLGSIDGQEVPRKSKHQRKLNNRGKILMWVPTFADAPFPASTPKEGSENDREPHFSPAKG
ncbi:hypothetical protein BJX70DRAFT_18098 [Aspergillus crustosus]